MLCGDFTFPGLLASSSVVARLPFIHLTLASCAGIGVPATATSGAIVANTLVSVPQHIEMLKKLKLPESP